MQEFQIPDGFKVIPGFEDYAINSQGTVMRVTENGNNSRHPGNILKPSFNRGYLRVSLTHNGKAKSWTIHRLVMLTFVGPSKLQVNHIDGNKTNNSIANLEYCTGPENIAHGVKHRLFSYSTEHHNAKLTDSDIIKIRELYADGLKPTAIAKLYPVTRNVIKDILKRKTWKHVT